MKALSEYEQRALAEIHRFKTPQPGWAGEALQALNGPLDKLGDGVMNTPGVGWVVRKAAMGLVSVANDVAQWSVRPDAVLAEYQGHGVEVYSLEDLAVLDLSQVDQAIGWLGAKYKGIATGEGALAGVAGLPGIPPDIVALVTLNLRAIGEYATYCGFDVSLQQERLFAMHVLAHASSPDDASKYMALAQLVRIAKDLAKHRTWKELERHALVRVIQQIAKVLGIRLTKAKLAQLIPALGAVVGAGFNVYFTSRVCDTAYYLYRERFLARKSGDAALVGGPPPAPNLLEAGYEEEDLSRLDDTPPE